MYFHFQAPLWFWTNYSGELDLIHVLIPNLFSWRQVPDMNQKFLLLMVKLVIKTQI